MIRTVTIFMLVLLTSTAALAQEAPPPRRMPRTPVSRETLVETPALTSRELQGPAIIIDGEKLRIGQMDIRLFGIVPPQLAASFGPQARSALDAAIGGQSVSCHIRDRDRDGRLLANCTNAAGVDLALDLLKRGLAVALRGSIGSTEFAAPYLAAEQAAQSHKIGIWSVAVNAPAASVVPPKPEAAPVEDASKKEEKARADQAAQAKAATDAKAAAEAQANTKIAADILAQEAEAQKNEAAWAQSDEIGFFERYQILISGILMLATALCIAGALERQRIRDRRDETKALAAALRGELMAARGVCFGRAKSITSDAEDHTAAWPRIRTILYQAYVGRLGLLGAELARQVASVYGQSSDYAAIYSSGGSLVEVSKKHALNMLIKRLDEVLPKLADVERTGKISVPSSGPSMMAEGFAFLSTTAMAVFSLFRTIIIIWENARSAVVSSRPVRHAPQHIPQDPPHVTEYTEIIEAEMEQYHYAENVEPIDPSHRKRNKEKGAA